VLRGRLQGLERGFGGQHAALDGGVAALDARGVEVASASQPISAPPGNTGLGQALQAAGGDGARAVADALAAFDVRRGWRGGSSSAAFPRTG
jgi:hypothetical protein